MAQIARVVVPEKNRGVSLISRVVPCNGAERHSVRYTAERCNEMSDYNKKNLVEIMNDQGVPIIKTIRADAVSASPALPAEYKRLSRNKKSSTKKFELCQKKENSEIRTKLVADADRCPWFALPRGMKSKSQE